MDQQRKEAKEMFKQLSFGKKIEHIWYYYKRWIIIPLLLLSLVGFSIYQAVTKPQYDLEGTFFSEVYVSEEQIAELETYLSQFVEDRNGDGEKNIKIYSASIAMLGNEIEGSITINTKLSTEMAAGADPFILVDSSFREIINLEAYELAIETPQELTAIPEVQDIFHNFGDTKVYWVTRTLYQDERGDEEAEQLHDATIRTEKNIFSHQ